MGLCLGRRESLNKERDIRPIVKKAMHLTKKQLKIIRKCYFLFYRMQLGFTKQSEDDCEKILEELAAILK